MSSRPFFAKAVQVHLEYHDHSTVHIHGGEEVERKMAEFHRRHIDRLKEDLAEVIWRNKRSSFVNDSELA